MLCCVFTYIIGFVLIALLAIKLYVKITTGWASSYTCLVGKTAIVTGANTGIGYWTALDFAKRGARVILACRDLKRAETAKERIIESTGNKNVVVKLLDLSSLKSVRQFSADVNTNEDRLDILVNNAGGSGLPNEFTKDGLQLIMQVNYLAPFLLTHLLIEKLKQTGSSRIVNVSSLGASSGTLDINTINSQPVNTMKGNLAIYCNTKQGNVLFTNELSKRLNSKQVAAYSLHPGVVNTEITRYAPQIFRTISDAILRLLFKTAEEGAQTTIHCAVSQDLVGVSGKLYDNCKEIEMYKSCTDSNFARQLWEKSEELVKLSEIEKISN